MELIIKPTMQSAVSLCLSGSKMQHSSHMWYCSASRAIVEPNHLILCAPLAGVGLCRPNVWAVGGDE
jgi:hypothetical protein